MMETSFVKTRLYEAGCNINQRAPCWGLSLAVPILALFAAILLPDRAEAKYAAIVVDADTGQIYYARNADTRRFPASLTKMMTLYMAFNALDTGKLNLNQPLPVSRRAAGQAPSKLGLKAGQTITLREAINALSVKSANDVATVVGEAISGTEAKFARLMTRRAHLLGMKSTTFMNASGLPNSRQKSTARDMATLGKALLVDFPNYYSYFSKLTYKYNNRTYQNHNKLLRTYEGMDGIKTGYIRASGFNMVASAKRDGVRLIGVVFGGKTGQSRDAHMASLLNRSWTQAQTNSTVAALPVPKPGRPGKEVIPTIRKFQRVLVQPSTDIRWGVQIGAFRGHSKARSTAGFTAKRLQNLPATATVDVTTLLGESETLYRARIVGMDRHIASKVCRKLRRSGSPCVLVTPSGDLKIADFEKSERILSQ
jgi:D-alanyl-D-alanine carboxypeptidase